ncbi:MAG TPA: hypothetical protein VGV92_03850 [Gammaproteobacteria bacterium]|nr:hypothetical protein [Gammaproteobacteria bacterium]
MSIWQIIAIASPILLALYLLITDYIDLFPYNDVSKHTEDDRKKERLNYILPLISALASAFGYIITDLIALITAGIYLYGHIQWWWIPYFWGTTTERKQRYQKKFGHTLKVLPAIKDHPIPNLEHMPVGLLIIIWFVSALGCLFV